MKIISSRTSVLTEPLIPGILWVFICAGLSILFIPTTPNKAFHYGMIIVTQTHFALAYLYLFTSTQLKTIQRKRTLAYLALVALLLCSLYLSYKDIESWMNLVYLYFAWHLIRDEIFFRQPSFRHPHEKKIMTILQFGTIILLYVLTVGKSSLHALYHWPLNSTDYMTFYLKDYRYLQFMISLSIVIVCSLWILLIRKKQPVQLRSFFREHRSILRVFLIAISFGTVCCAFQTPPSYCVNAYIIYHVGAWHWYSIRKINLYPAGRHTWREWIRSSVSRFNLIYGLTQMAILILFVVFFSTFSRQGWLKYYFHPSYFNIWTIFHVTLSFTPKRTLSEYAPQSSGA